MRKITISVLLTAVILMFPVFPANAQVLVGDINHDGTVNILDYSLLSNAFGTNSSQADLNGDGVVNILDYSLLSNNFGRSGQTTPSPVATTPIWLADADTNGMSAWKSVQCPSGTTTIVNDPEGRYGKVYQTHLSTGATYSGDGNSRCEFYGSVLANGERLDYYEGDEYFYGWRTKVSDGIFTNNGNSGNFLQLKGDSSCSGPAVGMTMVNGKLTLRTELYGVFWNGPDMTSITGNWHDIVLHVKFSKNPSIGYVEAWLDGVSQTFIDGSRRYQVATMCPNDSYIYLKMGYYRGSHTEYPPGTHWFESPRLGSTYNSVLPR